MSRTTLERRLPLVSPLRKSAPGRVSLGAFPSASADAAKPAIDSAWSECRPRDMTGATRRRRSGSSYSSSARCGAWRDGARREAGRRRPPRQGGCAGISRGLSHLSDWRKTAELENNTKTITSSNSRRRVTHAWPRPLLLLPFAPALLLGAGRVVRKRPAAQLAWLCGA